MPPKPEKKSKAPNGTGRKAGKGSDDPSTARRKESDDSKKPSQKESDDSTKSLKGKEPHDSNEMPPPQPRPPGSKRKGAAGPSREVLERTPTPEGYVRAQTVSSDDDSEAESERVRGRRLRDTPSHRERMARELEYDDEHVRTPSPGLSEQSLLDMEDDQSDFDSVLRPLEEEPPYVPKGKDRDDVESRINSLMNAARAHVPQPPGEEGEGSSILDAILAEADASPGDDPDKGRPRGYARWSPSDKLQRLIDAVFRKPLTQERHAKLEVDQALPSVDSLFVPKVDALLMSRPDLKSQISKLPIEADLRNFLQNFMDAAGPLCTLIEEAHSSSAGTISGDRVVQLSSRALMFLGHASAYINQKRRQAILNLPAIKALSRSVDYKETPSEGRDLFGPDLKDNIRKRKQEATDLKDVLEIDQGPQRKFRRYDRYSGSGFRGFRPSGHSGPFRGESSKTIQSEAFVPRSSFKQPRPPQARGSGYQRSKNYQRPFPHKPGRFNKGPWQQRDR